jgi:SAM-dependent methyltransferase
MPKRKEWFGEWFNSPYYHILYQNRDQTEAGIFLQKLMHYLNVPKSSHILDVACGKGRHAIYLNQQQLNVVGIDLSEQNIKAAREYENESLKFYVHDMRHPFLTEGFDYVFNMFTSFGYFETEGENQQAITAMAENLKRGGTLVLDFLNPYRVIHRLVPEEIKIVDGIEFHITREYRDGFIIKEIRFEDNGQKYLFHEKVKGIRRAMFEAYFATAGLHVHNILGDYDLGAFNQESSDRLIFICHK